MIILPFYFGRKGLEQRQLSSLLVHFLRLDRAMTERSQMTSFDGVPLEIRHQRNRSVREQHLPISPSPPHPDSGELLEVDGEPLRMNSYVKTGEVRVCTIQALRPHGARKLTTHSYELLMHYAPSKPPSADKEIVQRHPRQIPRPPRPPRNYPQIPGHLNNTSLTYPHQIHTNNPRTEQSLLHLHSHTPRQIKYGTFLSQSQTSRFPAQLSRSPDPPTSGDRFLYHRACVVITLLCMGGAGLYGLFVLVRALIAMIWQWIHNLLLGK